jgi:hypothetical protein
MIFENQLLNIKFLFSFSLQLFSKSFLILGITERDVVTNVYWSLYLLFVGRVAQLVQRLATGWKVRGSNPGGGEIFRICPERTWGPSSLLYNGYLVFPGGKAAGT